MKCVRAIFHIKDTHTHIIIIIITYFYFLLYIHINLMMTLLGQKPLAYY